MEQEIEVLIELIKKKKQNALKQVMDLYTDSVYRVAASILGNIGSKMDIEECVQDVFLDVWNRIYEYEADRGSFKTWLLILCKYKALNRRKVLMGKYKVVELKDIQVIDKESTEDKYLMKERKEEVFNAINALNKTDRELFLRRYMLDQDIDEICSIMALTRQAVDNRLWRGRKAIRAIAHLGERRDINE